jgi:hypothetical protein
MGFPIHEREQLLNLKGVGETVIKRLEQLGYRKLSDLAGQDPLVITKQISLMIGSSCWHNSPQARGAIQSVIELANN